MMNTAFRRNACPTLAAPMPTGDGLLARLPPFRRSIAPDGLAALARSAARFGNGTIEISARGNVQIRGLREDSVDGLIDALAALGLAGLAGVPITVSPLADLDGSAAPALADLIEARIAKGDLAGRLAPKTAIVLDAGTGFSLDAIDADIRIRLDGEIAHLALGGTAATGYPIGAVAVTDLPETLFRILAAIAAHGPQRRIAAILKEDGADTALSSLALSPCGGGLGGGLSSLSSSEQEPKRLTTISTNRRGLCNMGPGLRRDDGQPRGETEHAVLTIGLPYGQVDAATLIALAEAASQVIGIAPAPGRNLLFAGAAEHLQPVRAAAASLGLIVDVGDPRRAISACIGSAGCASGHIRARTIAAELAKAAPGLIDGSVSLHVSGCAKGCAQPEAADLTIVGDDKGCGIVLQGRARDSSRTVIASEALTAGLSRLAAAVGTERRDGEPAATVLARMEPGAVEGHLQGKRMERGGDYLRDGHEIYERSFAIIRAEADLRHFSAEEATIAVRMIHASGFVPLAAAIRFGRDSARIAREALGAGAPIFCDAEMVDRGITRARLSQANEVICTLRDPVVPELAKRLGTTRSAAAVDLWGDRLAGALVVIGNAPTALFHLLDRIETGTLPRPAAIVGVPVGFVGAAESKAELASSRLALPYLIVEGRLGGSAIAAAAVNALASDAI